MIKRGASSVKPNGRSVLIPALFLHIQKTAGTSIVDLVSEHYGSSMTSHGDHVGQSVETFRGVAFVSGHFGYDFASRLMEDRYCFTFLRDPIARILSMYHYCRRQDPEASPVYRLACDLGLEGFLNEGLTSPVIASRIWNNQVWQLAYGWENLGRRGMRQFEPEELLHMAIDHLADFSHVGLTEAFEMSRDKILSQLGVPIPKSDVVSNARAEKESMVLTSTAQELLNELTVLDRQLYAHVVERNKSE